LKTGPAILTLAGIVLIAAFMLMPSSPEGTASVAEEADHAHETTQSESDALSVGDSIVKDAISKLESREVAPMIAIRSILDVAEQNPENSYAQFALGELGLQSGQFDKAIARFENVLNLDSQNGEAHLLLARARLALGDSTAAIDGLKKALETLSNKETRKAIEIEMASINPN
tara:strand:- start:692 stop:1210 length:519 start_codon:yes stop_codon:yes gene_type:complete